MSILFGHTNFIEIRYLKKSFNRTYYGHYTVRNTAPYCEEPELTTSGNL